MPKFREHELIYRAFNLFISNCLIGNKSLLWPEAVIWTPENVAEVKRRVVDNPLIGSDQSFTQKLLQQMKDATPELWMLLADIYYVYYLPSSSNKIDSKRAAIRWAIEQGRIENPGADSWLWKALEVGFARTSRLYHMKHTQFWLIITFADYLKHIPDAGDVISDYKKFQQILDTLLQNIPSKRDRANDMRHAMLYMTFPEHYEPILGNTDKSLIVQTYGKRISAGLSVDIDSSIENIREVLSKNFSPHELPFNFYSPSLINEWKMAVKAPKQEKSEQFAEEEQPENDVENKIIFISYRRDDSADISGRIYDWLVDNFSEEQVFKDVDSIPLGVNFKKYLTDIVSQCHVLLAVIGDKWMTISNPNGQRRLDDPTDFVRIEIEAALNRKIKVIPLLVQDARPPQEAALPPSLQELAWLQGIPIRRDPDFRNDVNRLIRALTEMLRDGDE